MLFGKWKKKVAELENEIKELKEILKISIQQNIKADDNYKKKQVKIPISISRTSREDQIIIWFKDKENKIDMSKYEYIVKGNEILLRRSNIKDRRRGIVKMYERYNLKYVIFTEHTLKIPKKIYTSAYVSGNEIRICLDKRESKVRKRSKVDKSILERAMEQLEMN